MAVKRNQESAFNVVGLDLSLTETGVSCGKHGELVIKPKLKGVERLWQIEKEVFKHTHHADLVVIEGYSFGSKGRAIFNIGELGGVIRLMLYKGNHNFIEVPPAKRSLRLERVMPIKM
jgi:hypothetical protein